MILEWMGLLATSSFYFYISNVEVSQEFFLVFNQIRERER
jgi:hypothetical protein